MTTTYTLELYKDSYIRMHQVDAMDDICIQILFVMLIVEVINNHDLAIGLS